MSTSRVFLFCVSSDYITGFAGAANAKTINDISAIAMTIIATFLSILWRLSDDLRLRSFSMRAALFFLGFSAIFISP